MARALNRLSAWLFAGGALLDLLGVVLLALWMRSPAHDSWDLPRLWLAVGALLIGTLLQCAALLIHQRRRLRDRRTPRDFLSPQEDRQVIEAIRRFEHRTSGEIRVHLQERGGLDVLAEAAAAFARLRMDQTVQRSGVLFFVLTDERRFAVIGDSGIHERVGADFWDETAAQVRRHFAAGHYAKALIEGIDRAGAALATHFPYREGDVNELPDEISRS